MTSVTLPEAESSAPVALLSAKGASKTYGHLVALDDVDLDVAAGEIHALLGANGAGKSTLVKIIAGMVQPDSGEVLLRGEHQRIRSVSDSLNAGIRVVHQELSVFPNLTVAQNLHVGISHVTGVDDLRAAYRALHEEWGVSLRHGDLVRNLSPVQQAIVSLSKSLVGRSDVLILDEPTAALSSREVDGLFRIVRRKAAEGTAVIFVSHRLREVAELCNAVTVLRNGRKVYTAPVSDVDQESLAELIVTGGRIDAGARATVAGTSDAVLPDRTRRAANDGPPALSVRGVQVGRKVLDVSFDVQPGEIVGLAGLVGSGRTEVLEAIIGQTPMTVGELHVDGKPFTPKNPHAAMARGIVLVPEERASQALFPQRDIGFNFSASRFRREGRGPGGIGSAQKRYDATSTHLGTDLTLKFGGLRDGILSLSGGNQQKVVLGRTLLPELKIMLLDEPTRGVDVGARREFEGLIRGLADRGVAIVYVASELAELAQCDRIVVMVEGQSTVEAPTGAEFDEDALTRLTFIPRGAAAPPTEMEQP